MEGHFTWEWNNQKVKKGVRERGEEGGREEGGEEEMEGGREGKNNKKGDYKIILNIYEK